MTPRALIDSVTQWASGRPDVLGLALVGSHARGAATEGSDIDFTLVCDDPARYLAGTEWVAAFGEPARVSFEDWGKVQSVRVLYREGTEVEFGIAAIDWASIPPDAGTAAVLRAGCKVLLDPRGLIAAVLRSALASP
jgi:aminoglycoside 6-adenylyltransferase